MQFSRKKHLMTIQVILMLVIATSCGFAEVKNKMYVPHPFASEEGKSVVSVYDLEDSRLISTIRTVPAATFARVTPDGKRIWIFSSKEKEVEIYDVTTDRVVGRPYLDFPACDAVFDPDGKTCYVANGSLTGEGDNSISCIDVETETASYVLATGRDPISLAIQKDGSRLYVANQADNSITVIDPRQLRVLKTIYAGVRPHRLILSASDRYLFVANLGVDLGRQGGSSVTVIETTTGDVVKVIKTGNGPSCIGLAPDDSRMVVCHVGYGNQENLWYYDLSYESNEIHTQVVQKIKMGQGIEFGALDPTGRLFVVPDNIEGEVYVVDIYNPGTLWKASGLYDERSYFVEFASVDIEREIAIRDSIIQNSTDVAKAQQAAFEKAYLYRTTGDQNAVVAAYNSIIERFPSTLAETEALLEMGDLCYDQQLMSNAADYYNRGLAAYGNLLTTGRQEELLDSRTILRTSERLGDLALMVDENYFENLYKLYVNVPMKLDEFPQLFFSFGVALRKLGDSKFASKCFTESESRLIELMDESLYQEMKFKIQLVRSDAQALLEAQRMKGTVTVDGSLDEWIKIKPVELDRRDNVIVNPMRWIDKNDASASFRVAYDQYNLYVAGEITDDNVMRLSRENGDYVGIYIDVRKDSGEYLTRKREIGEGVYSFRVIPPAEAGEAFAVETGQEIEPLVGGMKTSDGYTFELKIPLAYLHGLTPEKGRRIGFGIEVFDIDSASSNVPPKVLGWLMPARSAYGPRFSELFGILEF